MTAARITHACAVASAMTTVLPEATVTEPGRTDRKMFGSFPLPSS